MKKLEKLINKLNQIRAEKKAAGKKGFTLVELLVVIAILAILASVSVVGYLGFTTQAKQSNDLQELAQYKTALLASLMDGEEEVELVKDTAAATSDYDGVYTVSYSSEGKMNISGKDYKAYDNDSDNTKSITSGTVYYSFTNGKYTSVTANEDTAATDSMYKLETSSITAEETIDVLNSILGDNRISDAVLSINPTEDGSNTKTSITEISSIGYAHNYQNGSNSTAVWTISTGDVELVK